ncbi:MAG: replicative DNA helicase [Bacilli bacterium]|nr:replicative DNA helicase [Bacilli bacterium]
MAKKVANDLPHNSDAERAVLGSALLDKDSLLDVLTSLNESDFYEGRHQLIFRAISSINAKQKAVDVLTVSEELMNMKELENIGGVSYLQQCSDSMVALSALKFYIDIVYDQAVLRNMLITIRGIDEKYRTAEITDVNDFILTSETAFKDAVEKRKVSTFETMDNVAAKVKAKLDNIQVSENGVTGINTGFPRLNELTHGFQKGEMIIVAARPSVGKTAFALNIAHKVATRGGKAVAIFSIEMTNDTLFKRLLASSSCVSLNNIITGKLNQKERIDMSDAFRELSQAPIYLDETSGIKISDIVNKSRKLQVHEPNLGLIIIDYLGLVQTSSGGKSNPDSRQEEVRKISLTLKGLAKELNIPIIVVSQLSRDCEKRGENKRPMLSDLRDSGSIEQDADVVMLLYRADYYKDSASDSSIGHKKGGNLTNEDKYELAKRKKEQELGNSIPGNASYIEINVAKNRNGSTGKFPLFFYKDYQRFDTPSKEWEDAMREITKDDID